MLCFEGLVWFIFEGPQGAWGTAGPELPEVEIPRRGIEPFVLGKTITGVAVRNPNLRQRIPRKLARILVGQRVKRLVRRGKYLLTRSEEHTSELQSHLNLVCPLLL